MAIYTFYFRNGRGAITSFDFAECDGDEAALARSHHMLGQRDEATAVEVTEGARVVRPFVAAPATPDASFRPAS
jgi:hypothetical protein